MADEWMRPKPVWVDTMVGGAPLRPPEPGLLLEWRRIPDKRGVPQWWGLVALARGGGSWPWSLSVELVPSYYLKPAGGPK